MPATSAQLESIAHLISFTTLHETLVDMLNDHGNDKHVFHIVGGGFDDIEGTSWNINKYQHLTVAAMIENCFQEKYIGTEYAEKPLNLETLIELYCELNGEDCNVSYIGTEEDYEILRKEQARHEMEACAAHFAKKFNLRSTSVDFIAALQDEAESVHSKCNDELYAMQEDGPCAGFGISSEQYYADRDYVRSQAHNEAQPIEKLLEWLQENCPLQWAQAEEKRLVKA